jgi:hypothetical protein
MLSAAIGFCLLAGLGASCAAPYMPAHVALMERTGGVLMIAGLALFGAALPAA